MYGARCTGSELSLSDCDDYYYRDCRADEGAGVSCEYEPPSDTIVELVGGNTTAGNILVDGRPIWWVSVIRKDLNNFNLNHLIAIMVGMIVMQGSSAECWV